MGSKMRGKGISILIGCLKPHTASIVKVIVILLTSTAINMSLPLLTENMIDEGFLKKSIDVIILLASLCLMLYIIDALLNLLKESIRIRIYNRFQFQVKEHAFLHLMKMKISYFKKTNSTEMLEYIEDDIDMISSIVDQETLSAISSIFGALGGLIGLFLINWKLSLVVLAYVPINFFITQIFGKKNYDITTAYILAQQKYNKWFGDTLGGIEVIKNFNLNHRKKSEFDELQQGIIKSEYKRGMIFSVNQYSEMILIQVLAAVIYVFAGKEILNESMTIGGMVAFISYMISVTGPIASIINLVFHYSSLVPSLERYVNFMNFDEESDGGQEVESISDIVFEHVDFAYEASDYVLKDASFLIHKNRKTAIIGNNGQGKSTIISLILRMYQPSRGRILSGTQNIQDYNLEQYRHLFAVVNQNVYLFDDSIRNNICLYKPTEDELLYKVIDMVGLTQMVAEKTLDYRIGDNGAFLSGGQKQKIALARVLMQKCQVIIFDEATSSFDKESTNLIMNLLDNHLEDQTVIVITHHKEFIVHVDHILSVQDGVVNEQTTR